MGLGLGFRLGSGLGLGLEAGALPSLRSWAERRRGVSSTYGGGGVCGKRSSDESSSRGDGAPG